jgi:hypothetical protein
MIVDTASGETTVLDLVRGSRWRVPWHDPTNTISPSGRLTLTLIGGQLSVARLDAPDDPAALHDWVVHATNYTLDATGP